MPWRDVRSELAQTRDNVLLQNPREKLGIDRELETGLASAASRRGLARKPGDQDGGTAQTGGTNWEAFFTGDAMAGARMGMEVARVWPGVGAWTGLASDITGMIADIATISARTRRSSSSRSSSAA